MRTEVRTVRIVINVHIRDTFLAGLSLVYLRFGIPLLARVPEVYREIFTVSHLSGRNLPLHRRFTEG